MALPQIPEFSAAATGAAAAQPWYAQVKPQTYAHFGFITAAYNKNHQAWHDRLAGTYVMRG